MYKSQQLFYLCVFIYILYIALRLVKKHPKVQKYLIKRKESKEFWKDYYNGK